MRLVRTLLFLALVSVWHSSSPEAAAKDDPSQSIARLSVTVKNRGKGTVLPTPFTVLPGEKRAAIYVPESGGILLLEGEQVRHHFPIPIVPADASSAVDDLDATDRLLAGGRWTPGDQIAVELFIFDLESGRLLDHVESRNPRLGGEANERARLLWRVVVEGDTAGVYDPRLGATVPLWIRGAGAVPSADQIAHMRAGIGFGRDPAWIPAADGSLSIRRDGKTTPIAGVDSLLFMDGSLEIAGENGRFDPVVVMVDPRQEGGSSVAISGVRVIEKDGLRRGGVAMIRTSTADDLLELSADWIHGRPVCVRGRSIYRPYLGRDFLEIRRTDAEVFALPDRFGP